MPSLHAIVRFIVGGIAAVFAWLALPYILLALAGLLCMAIGGVVGHIVAGYLPTASIPAMPSMASLKARFTKESA